MTMRDAEVITRNIGELEFPTVNELALQFALFRVCIHSFFYLCLASTGNEFEDKSIELSTNTLIFRKPSDLWHPNRLSSSTQNWSIQQSQDRTKTIC